MCASGDTIAYSSPFVPPEWIAAHGLRPTRLAPDCADSAGAAQGVCPFAHAYATRAMAGNFAGVIFATSCDQMRRAVESVLPRERVFVCNVPATQTPASRCLYRDELERLGRWLAQRGGCACSTPRLLDEMRRCECERTKVEARPSGGLALVGGPLRPGDLWLFDLISRSGGHLSLDATETGERCLPARFDYGRAAVDPLEEIVHAYFDAIPDAFRRPDTLLHQYLQREIAARDIRGIVLVRYLWCDQWHAQLVRLKETWGLPVVEIDLGGQDHDLSRTRTRIESLMGILK